MAPTTPAIGRRVRMSAFLPLQASTTKTRGLRHDVCLSITDSTQVSAAKACWTCLRYLSVAAQPGLSASGETDGGVGLDGSARARFESRRGIKSKPKGTSVALALQRPNYEPTS
jgi:hypothetical protein